MNLDDQLQRVLLGNPLEHWIASASIALGILILAYVLKAVIATRLRKRAAATATRWDDIALLAVDKTGFLFVLALAIHFGTQGLNLPLKAEKASSCIFFFFLFYQLGVWLTSTVRFFGESYFRESVAKEPGRATTVSTLIVIANLTIWITMLLLLLANFGVDISALVAGLGIGGVAVALALQNILGDLFSSLSIVLDKPFVIGDSIQVNGLAGTVEHIGLKTTRIRSTTGEQLIFANSDILKNVVRNYKGIGRRRITFSFGLVYETPSAKLHNAREIVKKVVNSEPHVTFDRCHLSTFSASSLDYEMVYWMETSDYSLYVTAHHNIAVGILDAFRKEGLEFAYPHQVKVDKVVHASL